MGALARRRTLPAPLRRARSRPGARRHRRAARSGRRAADRGATVIHGLATHALRRLDPEDAHTLAVAGLKAGLGPRAGRDDPILAGSLAGVALPNVVGLAP